MGDALAGYSRAPSYVGEVTSHASYHPGSRPGRDSAMVRRAFDLTDIVFRCPAACSPSTGTARGGPTTRAGSCRRGRGCCRPIRSWGSAPVHGVDPGLKRRNRSVQTSGGRTSVNIRFRCRLPVVQELEVAPLVRLRRLHAEELTVPPLEPSLRR